MEMFGSLKGFQSYLTLRANINIFLWPSIHLNFMHTGQDGIYLNLKNFSMLGLRERKRELFKISEQYIFVNCPLHESGIK